MSIDVPPPTVSSPPRRLRASILGLWVLILGLASVVMFGNARSGGVQAYQKMVEDERVKMVSMLLVQMKSMERVGPASSLVRDQVQYLIKQMEDESRTPEDRLRTAILAGETLGDDAGLERLSAISGVSNPATAEDIQSVRVVFQDGPGALSEDVRNGLVRRYGYLGRLALAHGVPPDQEPRKTLEAEALRFTMRLTAVGVGLLILMMLALAAFIVGGFWLLKGKIRPAYVPGKTGRGVFLETFALYLVLYVALGIALRYIGTSSVQWTWTALLILPIAWMWVTLRGTSPEERRHAFGWHRGDGVLKEMAAGIGGYLAGLAIVACGVLVTVILIRITGIRAASPIVQELGGGPWRLVGLYALACIFAPVMEETMFRGALFHHLRQRWGWAVSAVLVSVIFAMLHPQGWVAIPALGSIAIVLAALREWRGSLIAPMTAHACSNFLVLTLALVLLR
jgi:membrane protease YdiL (CAAX protease family)